MRHTLEVRHVGLGKYRVLSGSDYYLLKERARAQSQNWDSEYQRKLEKKQEMDLRNQKREERRQGIESKRLHSESKREEAQDRTSEAEVADQVNERFNLASMDWEDFEQLVREIFEKEFNQNGGEVKVTRASRDGGVDAVAFDPDAIHGGKIVIQAKRYTNTVGVAFVRELWGTVMNEGAMKGILITTADYGPDAYDFAKGKPLVLMNGSNLLYLLEKQGRKAKIDIKEAKQSLGLKDKWAST